MTAISLGQPARSSRFGMRAITAAINGGRLSRDSGRYLVGPVQLREQSRWAISLRGRKNLPVDSSISSWAGAPAILHDIASAFEVAIVRSPKPIVRLILDGTAVRVWLDRIT
jgi:hypothetical protein